MKRTPLRKQSKTSISKLKAKLWKVFALYIKERDRWTCYTCGRQGSGSGMHAGHFISKRIGGIALYFHEDNVRAQCYNCNVNLGGNQWEYGKRLGEEKVEELQHIRRNVIEKWSEQDYLNKIEYYTQKLEELKHERKRNN